MITITNNIEKYYRLFETYEPFNNFLKYAIKYENPQIYVHEKNNDSCVILFSYPAYFILGEPTKENSDDVFRLFNHDSWIITQSIDWKQPLEEYYKDKIISHQRVLFSSENLNLNHILKVRKDLPDGLSIVPIEKKHLQNGMILDDVTSRFFRKIDFIESGFGFALIDGKGFCEGFALTNYPIVGKNVELYFRVGYDSYTKFRSMGLGTILCTHFIEEALKRGYNPVWDSANDISTHIAKKLGYKEEKAWFMYHRL